MSAVVWRDVQAQEKANALVNKPIPTNTLAGEAANLLLQAKDVRSKTTKAAMVMQADVMLAPYVDQIRKRDGSVTIAAVLQLILEDLANSQ